MFKRLVHYGIVLLVIAAVSAGILAGANKMTAPVIAMLEKETETNARKQVLPAANSFNEDEKVAVDGLEFVPGYGDGEEKVGYVVKVVSAGYAGDIAFMLGLDADGVITGLNVLSSVETPGLGAKILNADWQAMWIGRDVSYEFNKAVDAFAGATISPQAVHTGTIKTLNAFKTGVAK